MKRTPCNAKIKQYAYVKKKYALPEVLTSNKTVHTCFSIWKMILKKRAYTLFIYIFFLGGGQLFFSNKIVLCPIIHFVSEIH